MSALDHRSWKGVSSIHPRLFIVVNDSSLAMRNDYCLTTRHIAPGVYHVGHATEGFHFQVRRRCKDKPYHPGMYRDDLQMDDEEYVVVTCSPKAWYVLTPTGWVYAIEDHHPRADIAFAIESRAAQAFATVEDALVAAVALIA